MSSSHVKKLAGAEALFVPGYQYLLGSNVATDHNDLMLPRIASHFERDTSRSELHTQHAIIHVLVTKLVTST